MKLTVKNFFKTVLPSTGIYATITKASGSNYLTHHVHETLDSFLLQVENQEFAPYDYWFAQANFKQGYYEVNGKRKFRTQENADTLRSLFLDIDVGSDKPYKTTAEALQALHDFCLATKLDVPSIVYSGSGGLHVYWSFDHDLPKADWYILACALHEATVHHNLAADPARTRDCASMLRVPGTFNWKHALPLPVQLVYLADPQPVASYKEKLAGYVKQSTSVPATPVDNIDGVNLDILQALDGLNLGASVVDVPVPEIKMEYPKRDAVDVVAQCHQLQLQDGAQEPVWRGMLATLRHCKNGIETAHKLSRQDARYDKDITTEKLNRLIDGNIPPYTCETFERLRPEVCRICPHKGTIKSPISVPVSKITTVQIDETGEVEKTSVAPDTTLADVQAIASSIPDITAGKYRVNETGCFVELTTRGGERTWWQKFYPYPVYPIQRIRDRNLTGDLTMSYVFRKHHKSGYDDFQVMGETLMGQGINGFLGSVGFLLNQEERKHMSGFMIELLKEVGHEVEETTVMDKLGWDKDHSTFLLGNKLYKTSGNVVEIAPKGYAAEYSQSTVPTGSLDQWKKIANVYNKKGAEWGQMAVASAFASPLMSIGSMERAALLFLTGEKGVGKSTALHIAVSVFADPTRMLINKDDTPLARLAKLGMMSNISVGFDEMTDLSPQEASALAYQITQGRGKDRMADGGKGIQHNKTFWSCLPIMSANDSIINALSQHSFDATAQMSRVLEIKVTDINNIYTPEEFDEHQLAVRTLPRNYGVAGDVYMRWITANMDVVERLIYETEKLFIAKSGLNNNYRFYTYMCTRMLVGAIIAKKLGLIDYDTEALMAYMVKTVIKNKHRITKQTTDVSTLLGSFLSEHVANRIVVTSDERPEDKEFKPELGPGNDVGYVLQGLPQGRDLLIRVVRDEGLVYISNKAIKDWCAKTGIPLDKFNASLGANAEILSHKKREYLGKKTQWHDTGRVTCCVIKLAEPLDEDIAD